MGYCANVEQFTEQLKLYYSKIGRGLILNFLHVGEAGRAISGLIIGVYSGNSR